MSGEKRVNPGNARSGLTARKPTPRRLVVFCSTAVEASLVIGWPPKAIHARWTREPGEGGQRVACRPPSVRTSSQVIYRARTAGARTACASRALGRVAKERSKLGSRPGFRESIASDVLSEVNVCVHELLLHPRYRVFCYYMQQ